MSTDTTSTTMSPPAPQTPLTLLAWAELHATDLPALISTGKSVLEAATIAERWSAVVVLGNLLVVDFADFPPVFSAPKQSLLGQLTPGTHFKSSHFPDGAVALDLVDGAVNCFDLASGEHRRISTASPVTPAKGTFLQNFLQYLPEILSAIEQAIVIFGKATA